MFKFILSSVSLIILSTLIKRDSNREGADIPFKRFQALKERSCYRGVSFRGPQNTSDRWYLNEWDVGNDYCTKGPVGLPDQCYLLGNNYHMSYWSWAILYFIDYICTSLDLTSQTVFHVNEIPVKLLGLFQLDFYLDVDWNVILSGILNNLHLFLFGVFAASFLCSISPCPHRSVMQNMQLIFTQLSFHVAWSTKHRWAI